MCGEATKREMCVEKERVGKGEVRGSVGNILIGRWRAWWPGGLMGVVWGVQGGENAERLGPFFLYIGREGGDRVRRSERREGGCHSQRAPAGKRAASKASKGRGRGDSINKRCSQTAQKPAGRSSSSSTTSSK